MKNNEIFAKAILYSIGTFILLIISIFLLIAFTGMLFYGKFIFYEVNRVIIFIEIIIVFLGILYIMFIFKKLTLILRWDIKRKR
ncbi:MAG: hypothetical protein ACFFG0_48190 [Candidatus Thorarchaeota archaeon]